MKIFYILLVAIGGFFLNIGLYYSSDGYREFLQSLKSEKEAITVDDDYKIEPEEVKKSLEINSDLILESELNEDITGSAEEKLSLEEELEQGDSFQKINIEEKIEIDELEMSAYDKDILGWFSNFSMTQLHSHGSLFDVTTEYPDKYFEYYDLDLSLIFFPTKNYDGVKEVFEIESGNIFSINELDNFGDESFYINLGDNFQDGYVRIVISHNGSVFGLKISKNAYNDVKKILKQKIDK